MKNGLQQLNLPAGFRFHPTDEELVLHYLCRKCAGHHISVPVAADLDLYKFDPWDLPALALYGEKEWYFFSPRDRKYPNGSRPNRSAGTGYWKATGADKPVGKPKTLGIKKSLVFYAGKAPTGVKTNWIMHEYRLANVDRSAANRDNMKLDDWVLCRIYNKKGALEKHYNVDRNESQLSDSEDQKPKVVADPYMDMAAAPPPPPPPPLPPLTPQMMNGNRMNLDIPDSLPKMHADSGSSDLEHKNALDFERGFMDAFQDELFMPQMQYDDQFSMFQETLAYMQKPF